MRPIAKSIVNANVAFFVFFREIVPVLQRSVWCVGERLRLRSATIVGHLGLTRQEWQEHSGGGDGGGASSPPMSASGCNTAGLEDADAERGWFSGIQGMFGRRSSAAGVVHCMLRWLMHGWLPIAHHTPAPHHGTHARLQHCTTTTPLQCCTGAQHYATAALILGCTLHHTTPHHTTPHHTTPHHTTPHHTTPHHTTPHLTTLPPTEGVFTMSSTWLCA